jgi:mitogen-activated protein kinase kinase 7
LYSQPERIEPPDPEKPDYDIRADVWALGISLVELATGVFPYAGCHTDFELLSKIVQDVSPRLPRGRGFSMDFCSFVDDCLIKSSQDRPKYNVLLVSFQYEFR